jgi:hypothetical protein
MKTLRRLRCRKALAARALFQKRVLGAKRIKVKLRVRLLKALILPTLTYGLEALPLAKIHLKRLESTQMILLRGITHDWAHHGGISNDDLRSKWQIPTVESRLRQLRLKWMRSGPSSAIFLSSPWQADGKELPPGGFLKLLHVDLEALGLEPPPPGWVGFKEFWDNF